MFQEGLSYPFKGENALGRNLIGGLLLVFFWLVVPLLAFFGYIVRVLRTTAAGEEEPPDFDDWGEMIVDGLKGVVVFAAYGIIPYALLGAVVSFVGILGQASGGSGQAIVGGVGLLGFLLTLVVSIVVQYVTPAALANFAREESVAAAFDFSTLKNVLTSTEYFVAWLLPIVVFVLLYVIGIVLALTLVGVILLPWLYFYGFVVTYRMFGSAYADSLGLDEERPDPDTDREPDSTPTI